MGYDCNSAVGSPLWVLTSPDASGPFSPLAAEVTISQVDPATGATTAVVAVGDATADLTALAVVPAAAPAARRDRGCGRRGRSRLHRLTG